jgi:hypothetical protein
MARHRAGVAKRNRGCCLCKPHRAEGNGAWNREHILRHDPLRDHRAVGHRVHESEWRESKDQTGSI